MENQTPCTIAKALTAEGIPTPSGKEKWATSTVESILKNEKYKGSAVLQKKFTVNFLNKEMKRNEGEVPQYLVEHSHEAIIDPMEWDMVQAEISRRKEYGNAYSGNSVFSSKIVCADCGSFYGQKTWHSNSKYRRKIWQCNNKFKGDTRCETPKFYEEEIKERFLAVYNRMFADKEETLENCRIIQATLTDCTSIDEQLNKLLREIEIITELTKRCIADNAESVQNQAEFTEKYNGYVERYETVRSKAEKLQQKKTARLQKADSIGAFMFAISELDEPLTVFDEKLWLNVIDKVIAHKDGRLVLKFKDGTEVEG